MKKVAIVKSHHVRFPPPDKKITAGTPTPYPLTLFGKSCVFYLKYIKYSKLYIKLVIVIDILSILKVLCILSHLLCLVLAVLALVSTLISAIMSSVVLCSTLPWFNYWGKQQGIYHGVKSQ